MKENDTNSKIERQSPKPNPDLKSLEKLVGTWKVTGGIEGANTFEWTENGFFLIQHFDFRRDGHSIKGIEIIGHDKDFFGASSEEIKTRVYSFTDGMTLDYVYEMDERGELTIWMEKKGSDGFMKGVFSDDGNTMNIEWIYPGGGYTATATKSK